MKGSFLTRLYIGGVHVFPSIFRKLSYASTAFTFLLMLQVALAVIAFTDYSSLKLAPSRRSRLKSFLQLVMVTFE
jgi:hypothetical protein